MPFIKKAVPVFAILIGFLLIYSCSASKKTIVIPPPPPPPPIVKDMDNDGITDELDRCPDVAGLASLHGCPDRDGDGITDAEDKCPNVAGLARYQGCPVPDTDKDGVADEVDRCPSVPGYARYSGCPIPDTDGDGVNDENDKCFTVKGPPDNSGCPLISEPYTNNTRDTGKYRPQPIRVPVSIDYNGSPEANSGAEPVPEIKPVDSIPKVSMVYSYKKKMKVGETGRILLFARYDRTADYIKRQLLDRLNQDEGAAKKRGSADTSFINWREEIKGYKSYKIIPIYDTTVFSIKLLSPEIQDLDTANTAEWTWSIKALRDTDNVIISMGIYGINNEGSKFLKAGDLPISVTVDQKPFPLAWLIAGILFALLLAALFIWLKARRKTSNKQIFFSYNWHQEPLKIIVDEMYSSLKKAGFNVVKDKEDLHYGGSISHFMSDLSKSKLVIVAVCEKYLKSVNCMKELFHIYSNAGMNKNEFQKRIFPVTTEQLNLTNLDVVKSYEEHWIAEQQKWENYTREHSNSVTKEEAEEYEFTRRVAGEITNILSYLYDINAMNIEALKQNDFEMVKKAIRDALDGNK